MAKALTADGNALIQRLAVQDGQVQRKPGSAEWHQKQANKRAQRIISGVALQPKGTHTTLETRSGERGR